MKELNARLREYALFPGMEELIALLEEIPDTYPGFVAGIVAYTSKSPDGLQAVKEYIESTEDLTTSDVVQFASDQPDFHDCGVNGKYGELFSKLNDLPNSHLGFVADIFAHARKKPERFEEIMNYLNSSDELTASDVVRFVLEKTDIYGDMEECEVCPTEKENTI